MKVHGGSTLIAASLRRFIAAIKLDKVLDQLRMFDELVSHIQALPWDHKVFAVTDERGAQWAADIRREGPTLTITPLSPEIDGSYYLANGSFWKRLAEEIENSHPGFHFEYREGFFERLLKDRDSEARRKQLAKTRQEDEPLREQRLKQRELQRQNQNNYRSIKAAENRTMYSLWYQ